MKHPGRLLAGVAALALAATAGCRRCPRPARLVVGRQRRGRGRGDRDAGRARRTRRSRSGSARSTSILRSAGDGGPEGRSAAASSPRSIPKQPQLVARQRLLFTNLRKFGFTS